MHLKDQAMNSNYIEIFIKVSIEIIIRGYLKLCRYNHFDIFLFPNKFIVIRNYSLKLQSKEKIIILFVFIIFQSGLKEIVTFKIYIFDRS